VIRFLEDGGLSVITLDRPEKANALSRAMLQGELAAVRAAAARDAASALLITGAGPVFSAGADMAELPDIATAPEWEALSAAVAGFPGLAIAALNGPVAGGALCMVLACDLRLAVPGARAFYPVMKMGVLPQPSDPGRLADLVGPGRAAMLLLGGARIPAEEALAWGLYDRIVGPDDLMPAARALATDALSAAAGHAAAVKAMLRRNGR
jgi:enoyl-CoA hydratase/carnithine racemase